MSFKILARTILHLGSELISSDGVAFYELIKNAHDAGSPKVVIRVKTCISYHDYINITDELDDALNRTEQDFEGATETRALNELQNKIITSLDSSKRAERKIKTIQATNNLKELKYALDMLNIISVKDSGHGMSLEELDEIYLTIGTRVRLEERKYSESVVLGEKGIGRLSAMRLGDILEVKTTRCVDQSWNRLDIDWRNFSHDSDDELQDISIEPYQGKAKKNPATEGTTIIIGALNSAWNIDYLADIAKTDFSKLTDPFHSKKNFPIKVFFNKEKVLIPRFASFLFNEAHAKVKAKFTYNDTPRLSGKIEYGNKKTTFKVEGLHLLSAIGDTHYASICKLGEFRTEIYWYNRRNLKPFGDLSVSQYRKLINSWAGGLMVYRDGFRVNPYGNMDDDWLDQDKKALASGGYKLNRRQTIGRVELSSIKNPKLTDQANREGIRQSSEFEALKKLLQHVLQVQLRGFMNRVKEEADAANHLDFKSVPTRIESHKEVITSNLNSIAAEFPQVKKTSYIKSIRSEIDKLDATIDEAKNTVEGIKQGHEKMLFLAGLGLMVDTLAHELDRATGNTLDTLRRIDISNPQSGTEGLILTLEAQLKTLKKRLQTLDPLGTATRQTKEKFELYELIEHCMDAHEGQLQRHEVTVGVAIKPDGSSCKINAVKGMIVQILENLLSNSIYWLKMQSNISPSFLPHIDIVIDSDERKLLFTDNGPGVPPEDRNIVFEAFHSTKPAKDGKGLGLYISRQLAEYHGYSLQILEEHTVNDDSYNTFVLDF